MGYWEQIGEANIAHRERLAQMPPWRRALRHWSTHILVLASWLAAAGVIILNIWRW